MFNDLDPSKKVTFKEAFPTIQNIKLDIEIEDWDHLDPQTFTKVRTYNELNFRNKIPCPNPRCNRGGITLQDQIEYLVSSKEKFKKLDFDCPGDEGTPKGMKKGPSCFVDFKIQIEITYKDKSLQE